MSDMRIVAALMAVLMLVAIVPAVSAEQTVVTPAAVTSEKDGTLTLDATKGYTAQDAALATEGTFADGDRQVSALELQEGAAVTWQFEVPASGAYTLSLKYLPLPGTSNDMEITVQVNENGGSQELTGTVLKRVWQNAGAPTTDNRGNQIRPQQVEAAVFTTTTLRDPLSAEDNTYTLTAGTNTISLTVTREHLALCALVLTPAGSVPTYAEYAAAHASAAKSHGGQIYIEGEDAVYKSNSSLYAITDRSSPDTSPSHYSLTLLNSIGGTNWSYTQQWIEWELKVPETGLYKLTMRVRQNTTQGQNASRRIYIDGKMPFAELNSVVIPYNAGWQQYTVGGDETPYLFYLEEGTCTLRMENTIGTLDAVIQETDRLLNELNTLYRTVMGYIGSQPDADRDYKLDELIPDLKERLLTLADDLAGVKADLLAITGEIGEGYAQFQDLERQLRQFHERIAKLPRQFDQFRTNIRALSEWLLTAQKQPLVIDCMTFSAAEAEVEQNSLNFFQRVWYDICAFFATFTNDYSSMTSAGEVQETITVWLGSTTVNAAGVSTAGRDQATALRGIINAYFTPQHGIGVDLKLVDGNSLIPAVATGNGPDVSLFIASKSVMDYGFRGALLDLASFEDYEDSLGGFWSESLVPFTYDGKAYALPDSYSYSLMFYRKDILDELGVSVPQTWQDVFGILPVLNNNYMTFGLPSLTVDSIETFTTMLYQKGGSAYDDKGTVTEFASVMGIEAFEMLTDFYTKYDVPQTLDQLTYFRTGEAPLVIAPYTFCNNLAAGAPEIEGLWGAAQVPGTADENGTVNHTVTSLATGTVIFANTEHPDASWEFLKWWTSADAQYEYGIEVETTLGESGRIATATVDAMKRLPWDKDVVSIIGQQLEQSRALPEVPGGYMSTRYIPTAMRLVVNNNLYPRDALITYSSLIDEEIATKRQEFHFE